MPSFNGINKSLVEVFLVLFHHQFKACVLHRKEAVFAAVEDSKKSADSAGCVAEWMYA